MRQFLKAALLATPALAAEPAFLGPMGARPVAPAQRQAVAGAEPQAAAGQGFVEAQEQAESASSPWKWLAGGLLAGVAAAALSAPANAVPAWQGSTFSPETFTIKAAKHLQPCKDNKKFHKRIKNEIYKNTQRQKKYAKDSVVWKRFEVTIDKIKAREVGYGDRLCGKKDGLPRVIATGENVRGGVVIPGLMFLYTAGWIGWAGRSYLMRTRDEKKEINLDVPLFATCVASGFAWPVAAWQDIVNGDMNLAQTDVSRTGMPVPSAGESYGKGWGGYN